MELDRRLAALAAFVPPSVCLADIGTDHAYLPTWLVQQGRITRAIASDVLPGPCQAAEKTVAAAGLTAQIAVRCGDGLATLTPGEADTIAIAGMGGPTMLAILEREPAVVAQAQQLILQPMGGVAGVRRWLYEHGWHLEGENVVVERGRWYEILSARPGRRACPDEALLWLGPLLVEQQHPLAAEHAAFLLDKLKRTLAAMQGGKDTTDRQAAYRRLIAQIEEVVAAW